MKQFKQTGIYTGFIILVFCEAIVLFCVWKSSMGIYGLMSNIYSRSFTLQIS